MTAQQGMPPSRMSGFRSELNVFYAFFYRSLVQQLSFRSWFVMRILGMFVGVTTYSIFAKVVPSTEIAAQIAAQYHLTGKNPFLDFFLIGMLVQNMVALGSAGISHLVNSPFYPYYHASPTRLITVFFGNNAFRYLWVIIETFAYIAVGLTFGMTFYMNFGFVLVLVTGILLTFSLDLLSAGWNIITKTGEDPLNWFLDLFSRLVTGSWIPVQNLPNWLQAIAAVHPQRYVNDMARLTIGGNAPLREIWPQLGPLMLITAVITFVGYRAFKYGFWKARDEGTLGHAMSGFRR